MKFPEVPRSPKGYGFRGCAVLPDDDPDELELPLDDEDGEDDDDGGGGGGE